MVAIACCVVVGCFQLKTNAPKTTSESLHDIVKNDLRTMVKDLSPLDAEAILVKNGYKVQRYCDAGHEIILATHDRIIPTTASAIQEVKAAITFESGVFTDLIVEEAFIQKP